MKDYDTTLARIAGNIAAGIVSADPLEFTPEFVACRSVLIAALIVAQCKGRELKNDSTNNA